MINTCTFLPDIKCEIIEQIFHVSRLKKRFLRLPTGKTVTNISDYKLACVKAKSKENPVLEVTQNVPGNVNNDSTETVVKSVFSALSINQYRSKPR